MFGGWVKDKAEVVLWNSTKTIAKEKNRDPYPLRKEKVMKVGFAVQHNEGIESRVYEHFGSAPVFIIFDMEAKDVLMVNNRDLPHVHGACNPIMALDGKSVDAMVVGGIGSGALTKLNAMGVKVYAAAACTVKENLDLLGQNKLEELSVYNACRAHEGGCGHEQPKHAWMSHRVQE
jgi:predicted Fe-Mo cluster-binding NifX family protein